MKVSIVVLTTALMIAIVQNSVIAGQTANPVKPSGKMPSKTPPAKRSTTTSSKKPAQKVTSPSTAVGQTVKPQEKLVARESLIGAGDVMPAYSVTKYSDGKLIELSMLVTGQAVVVLYHPGSKPAMRALTQIASVAVKAKPGIKVYALCVRTDEVVWKASVKALPATMLPLYDPAGRKEAGMNARKVLGCDAYPTIIVTGPDGKVRDAFAGWFSGDRRLAPLLSE